MQYKQLIAAFAVTAWSAISTVAMEHGEYAEHNGLLVRYHQLAPGVFSGIRAEDWNDASMPYLPTYKSIYFIY